MKKLSLFCAGALLSTSIMAQNYSMWPNMDINYTLKPGIPETFHNPVAWTVDAKCTLIAAKEVTTIELVAEVVSGSGKLNGNVVSEGYKATYTFKNGQVLNLSADGYAEVELTNISNQQVEAKCHTS